MTVITEELKETKPISTIVMYIQENIMSTIVNDILAKYGSSSYNVTHKTYLTYDRKNLKNYSDTHITQLNDLLDNRIKQLLNKEYDQLIVLLHKGYDNYYVKPTWYFE